MSAKRYIYLTLGLFLVAASCTRRTATPEQVVDTVAVDSTEASILVTDEDLMAEANNTEQPEELFDDFLYHYVQDTVMQRRRAIFPLSETLFDGSTQQISESDWSEDYYFDAADYTIALYTNEAEMSINEDTAILRASVEKIDLTQQKITTYDFLRHNKHWNLVSIRNMQFANSDLRDFLMFYSHFAIDNAFRNRSVSRSIHVNMTDPDDESQNIEGFINREQWPTVCSEVPSGIIMNIRYGQQYLHTNRILMEKTSMGDGMSEIFYFTKSSKGWELVGYEN